METYWLIAVFAFGTIIGSFLNVVIYRLHTGKSLGGNSHCMTCGTHLLWYELFPVLSYVALRARCRTCRAYIPARYLVVEFLTGALFLLVFTLFRHDVISLAFYFTLSALLVVILVYDIRHTIIPNELTFFIGLLATTKLTYESFIVGGLGPSHLLGSVLAGLCAGGFFAALWYISKGRWLGLGDAKLALPLGVMVGSAGAFSMVVISFWVGAIVSLCLIGVQRLLARWKTQLPYLHKTITIRSEVPFAPFLVTGFLLVEFFHADIFSIIQILLRVSFGV